jgi:hypothetical protein
MKKKNLFLAFLVVSLFSGCLSADNTPSPTNLPPVSTENRKAVLTSFVQENGSCQLPCILGLTPGISDSAAVTAFMGYFQTNSSGSDDQTNNVNIDTFTHEDWKGTNFYFFENKVNVWISVEAKINQDRVERLVLLGQAMQMFDGGAKKLFGDPYYDELLVNFSLSNVLEEYGQPEQIIIRPFPDDEGYPSPPAQYTFDFVLFYPKKGFVAEYVAVRAAEGSDFVGCPNKSYIAQISSWNPERSVSITEAVQYFSNLDGISEGNISEYKQLQDVTSLSLTDFYNVFRMSNSSDCVKTRKELWTDVPQ